MDSQQSVSNTAPQQPVAVTPEPTNNVTQIPPPTPDISAPKKTPNFLLIAVIVIVVLLLAGGGILLTKPAPSPTPIATDGPSFKLPPAPTVATNSGTLTYSNIQQGYGFNYLKSWIVDMQGSLTVAADPALPVSKQCAASLEKLLACNAMISSIPFMTPSTTAPGVTIIETSPIKSKDQQTQDLASQLTTSSKAVPITIGKLSGYEITTTTTQGSTYNVLLQGQKNMILVQFPNMKFRTDLSNGQSTILQSIIEQ